jgi:hypothetical protein
VVLEQYLHDAIDRTEPAHALAAFFEDWPTLKCRAERRGSPARILRALGGG